MAWWKEQLRRVGHLLKRDRFEDDLEEEMRLHLDLRAAGNSPAAEREARMRFGNVTRLREDSRSAWGWPWIESVIQDVRYGIRTLVADPAFTITAVVSLTLGIGANTAIFSIVNAVMLRSLPVQDPQQLVQITNGDSPSFTNPLWEQIRDHQTAFSGILANGDSQFDLNEGGESRLARGLWVNGDFFRVLGVPALRGRIFTADDDRHGGGKSGPVAIISYALWNARYHADPDIVGKTIKLDRKPFEIVGVTPSWFGGLDNDHGFDVAIPIGCEPLIHTDRSALDQRSWWWLRVVGRLKAGETIEEAQSRMSAIAPEIMRATTPHWNPEGQKKYQQRTFNLSTAATGFSWTRMQYRVALFTLMTLVVLVLLIACANVANLLLARASARRRELTVRLAIGANRSRIVRQLLTESMLLALAGAAGGLALAKWGGQVLVHFLSTRNTEVEIDTSLDPVAGAFIAIVVVLTTLLFGLVPAFRGSNAAPNDVLKENARGAVRSGAARFTLGKSLVSLQVALSLTLLIGTALFVETFRRLTTLDAGFDRQKVQLVSAQMPQSQIEKSQRVALFDRVLDRLRSVPGVQSASRSDLTPISNMTWNEDFDADGFHSKSSDPEEKLVYCNRVSPGYLRTMGTPILAGRDFTERDTLTAPKVMLISEATARTFFGSGNPIGRTLRSDAGPGKPPNVYEVIGVVKDTKYESMTEKTLKTAYFAANQEDSPRPQTVFELRLNQSAAQVLPLVRDAVADVDKNISLQVHSLERQIDDSLIRPRLMAVLSAFFGGVALLLATTGLYGIIAYSIARRKAEIGLRIALGARYGSVIWLVLRDVAVMLILGGAAGLTASHFATKLVESLVFNVKPGDPAILSSAVLVLFLAAALAGYLPARRAARMDPMQALRME